MRIKNTKEIIVYAILFLVVIVSSVLIFINREKQYPITADSIGSSALSFSGGGAKTVGDNFNLSALITSGGNRVCVIDFTITYPANLLELKSSSLGTPFNMATVQSISAGSIHYQIGATGCSAADATILNMSFDAKAVGDATVTFSAADLLGGDDGSQAVTVSKGSTTVNIAAVAAAPAAPAAPVNTNTNTKASNTNTNKKTTTTSNKNSNINQNSNTAVVALLGPTLLKLEYTADVILDSVINRSKGIAFSGTADPEATINIAIASDPISATTQSDATGSWMYTLTDWLDAGAHTITLSSEKNGQKSAEVKMDFVTGTKSKNQIAIGTVLPAVEEVIPEPTTETAKSNNSFMTIAIIAGSIIGLLAIILLIIFISKRRHYLKVAKEITGSMQANSSLSQGANNEVTGSFLNNQENPLQVPGSVDVNAQNQMGATGATSPSSISTPEGEALPVEPVLETQNTIPPVSGGIGDDTVPIQEATANFEHSQQATPWSQGDNTVVTGEAPATVAQNAASAGSETPVSAGTSPEGEAVPASEVTTGDTANNEMSPANEVVLNGNEVPVSTGQPVLTGASQYETQYNNLAKNAIVSEVAPESTASNEMPTAQDAASAGSGTLVSAGTSPEGSPDGNVDEGSENKGVTLGSDVNPVKTANNTASLEPEITFDDEYDEEDIMNQNNTKKSL